MTFDIKSILERVVLPEPLQSPVVIYGAGNTGKVLCEYLSHKGYSILAFLDANAKQSFCIQNVPVHTLEAWCSQNSTDDVTVIVAIHNYKVEMLPVLTNLKARGFKRIVAMPEFTNIFPEDQPARFWLAPYDTYRKNINKIEKFLSLLAEEKSRDWAERILKFRIAGDYEVLPVPIYKEHYSPKDIPAWKNPLRLIDCGAYTGDTIKFLSDGYVLEAVAAFEPDLANYQHLAEFAKDINSINFPCGVSSKTEVLRFNAGDGEGSHISSSGEQLIQCVTLDDAIPNFAPSLIKMDIEGAEIDALIGAKNIICKHLPGLAISLYHTPEHLWEIPLLIHSWNLGYEFYIRGHAYNTFETVLYAIPENKK